MIAEAARGGTAHVDSWINSIKTVVLLAALGGLMVLVGDWVAPGGNGALVGLAIGLAIVGITYWFSDRIAIAAARARRVSEADAPALYRIVRELTSRAGLPTPKIYVTPAKQPNAFATGRSPHHAVVAATTGILEILDEDELRAVLAHELSHVKNRDVLIGSVAAAIGMGITLVARVAMFGAMFGGRRRMNPISLIALVLLAPLAMIMKLAVSRSREYQADWSRGRAHRRRRASGPGPGEDPGCSSAHSHERRSGPRHRVHRQSPERKEGVVRRSVLHAPTHRPAHRAFEGLPPCRRKSRKE